MAEGQSKWAQDFFDKVEPIKLKDPLAYFLGAMSEGDYFIFKYADAVKLAGHSCPAVSGAYKITAKALKALYGDEIPVRGEIRVAILGRPTDMAYGPMSQVITFITGASTITGFGGLAGKFKRRNNLVFDEKQFEYNTFIFQRMDTKKMVKVVYNNQLIPEDPKLGELFPSVISGTATEKEKKEFQRLWQDKVRWVLLGEDKIEGLFVVEEIRDYTFPEA